MNYTPQVNDYVVWNNGKDVESAIVEEFTT